MGDFITTSCQTKPILDFICTLDTGNAGESSPLTHQEVIALQQKWGANVIQSRRKRTWYGILGGALFHPFNILLLFLAVVSGLTHELKTTGVMLVMVILSTLLRFYQEYKSEVQAQSLLKFVASKVLVIRCDPLLRKETEQLVLSEELVPGDLIRLAPGDLVPADVEIVEDKDFNVSQAALSGEPLPVHKYKTNASRRRCPSSMNNGGIPPQVNSTESSSLDRPLLQEIRRPSFEVAKDALAGRTKRDPEVGAMSLDLENPELCFLGSAVISGTAICKVLRIGSETVFGQLAEVLAQQQEPNAFESGVRRISHAFFCISIIMAAVVLLLQGFLTSQWYGAVIFALSVAVGLTPEMLPMVVNTSLSKGTVALSNKRCIVKKLDAVVNVGSMQILCTDKTGTLTTSRVNLHRFVNSHGRTCAAPLELGYLNSHFQSVQDSALDSAIVHYYQHQYLHTTSDTASPGRLSPTRRASRSFSNQLNVGFASRFTLLDELPFDFVRRRMSVILHDHVHENSAATLICKGAVDEVLSVCTKISNEDTDVENVFNATSKKGRTTPLSKERMDELMRLNERLTSEGFRVLAVAYRSVEVRNSYTKDFEAELTFAGYLGFLDPPKDSAKAAISKLVAHGVQVKVMSGDSPLVCKKVCDEIGLQISENEVTTGDDLESIKDPALLKLKANSCSIFAKLTPVQKADLVKILQMDNCVVGFLGDGINDAAALAEADVGISVDTGTDVAKESSDIILLDKDLTVIADAVLIGRKTFGNTMKYIVITISSNFGNVFSILTASAWLPFLPIGSFHILIQNLLYDVSQMAIPWDNMDEDYLKETHVWSTGDIFKFMLFMGPWSSVFDIITFAFLYFYFGIQTAADENKIRIFQTTWFTVGLLTQAVIVHMVRSPKIPFIQSRATLPVILMTLIVSAIGLSLPFIPGVVEWVGMARLPWEVYPFVAGVVLSYCITAQFAKMMFLRLFKKWY